MVFKNNFNGLRRFFSGQNFTSFTLLSLIKINKIMSPRIAHHNIRKLISV